MLPDVCFDALHQVIPGQVPAEGTSNLWNLKLGAGHGMTGTIGNSRPFMVTTFHSGGTGARPTLDGLSATPFPSGVRNVPVEITETIAPVVVWKKEYRQDSGGAGQHRGGLGQVMEVEHREGAPFGIFATFERVKYPARGREGGQAGGNGRLSLASGQELKAKGFQTIPAGERLVVFLDTVVKQVELSADGTRIVSMTCISRTPRPAVPDRGYDLLPSQDLADWYAPADSARFTKKTLRFQAHPHSKQATVFVDATEWGEVLALSGHPYLQGVENADGSLECRDRCGQATVYCFAQELHAEPVNEPDRPVAAEEIGYGAYRDKPDAWAKIWTYRRIRGRDPKPTAGDICLQNWGYSAKDREGGNDYPFAYLFLTREQAAAERADWRGGIDLDALRGAEDRAFAWHQWFRKQAPAGIDPASIALCSPVLGTGHGLAKLPYIRDTRRAIGLDGFVLKFADLTGPAEQRTGTVFPDRVALGAYPADIHPISGCDMPAYCRSAHDTLPFCIPFRALTHRELGNLLVAGKTMAQSFLANSATRLHPIEWSTGTAAGVAAARMATAGWTSRQALAAIEELQGEISKKTPLDWTLPEPR